MVFASLTFLYIFLPLNLALYYLLPTREHRNLLLVLFSFMFYVWGEPVWITLLFMSAAVDYLHGRLLERWRDTAWSVVPVYSSVLFNLGLLGVFKYSGFFVETVNDLLSTSFSAPAYTLPIGISFYTFQTISYVVDVHRGQVKAQRSFTSFLMFVSLYHQLVAGPIVRYADIAHEVDNRREALRDLSEGVSRFCVGLFKKVCIANVAGELVARYMDADLSTLSTAQSWFGLTMFSLQIYFDFSGYSDMAIGLGNMFGFHYKENFRHPYVSTSATEFWRRWHISLGSFFRDYLYVPLGGKRRHAVRNLFVVWFLTGLWHGASWNFVLWGLYFGVLIWFERVVLHRVLKRLPAVVGHAYLLFVAVVGWSLFYFTDLGRLGEYLVLMFSPHPAADGGAGLVKVIGEHAWWLALALALCFPVARAVRSWADRVAANAALPRGALAGALTCSNVLMLLLATSMLVGKSYNPFLYFRF